MIKNLKYYLPLTYPSVLRGLIPKNTKSIIDIGCGDGYIMSWINFGRNYKIFGIEISKQAVDLARKRKLYTNLYLVDILTDKLPRRKFDVVFCSQVIEHLEKKAALRLIERIEKLATKKVIIATTNGFFEYDYLPNAGKYDKHKSGWTVAEFKSIGYKVFGHGLKVIYEPDGIKTLVPSFIRQLLFCVSYILSPLMRVFPNYSLFLIAYKDID